MISLISKPVALETSPSNNFLIELSCIPESNSIALEAREAFCSSEVTSEAIVNLSIKYSDNNVAFLDFAFSSSTEFFSNKLAGSSPSGRNRNFIVLPSVTAGKTFLRAPHAAPLPASSPSKQKIISFTTCSSF